MAWNLQIGPGKVDICRMAEGLWFSKTKRRDGIVDGPIH